MDENYSEVGETLEAPQRKATFRKPLDQLILHNFLCDVLQCVIVFSSDICINHTASFFTCEKKHFNT